MIKFWKVYKLVRYVLAELQQIFNPDSLTEKEK